MSVVPVEYHYEFYTSRYGDPFFSCETSSPLAPMARGDYLDYRGFLRFPLKVAAGSRVRIEEIKHIIWEIENDHIGHKTMVVIEIVPE